MKHASGTEQLEIDGIRMSGVFEGSPVIDLEKFMGQGPDLAFLYGL
jgi:hypothetical protein